LSYLLVSLKPSIFHELNAKQQYSWIFFHTLAGLVYGGFNYWGILLGIIPSGIINLLPLLNNSWPNQIHPKAIHSSLKRR
jgi:hypothetical protein